MVGECEIEREREKNGSLDYTLHSLHSKPSTTTTAIVLAFSPSEKRGGDNDEDKLGE